MSRPAGLTKICPGYYKLPVQDHRLLIIDQVDEGSAKGEWIVRADWDPYLHSDPVETLREAAQVAQEMKVAFLRGDFDGI